MGSKLMAHSSQINMNTFMLITTGGAILMIMPFLIGIGLCYLEDNQGYRYNDTLFGVLRIAILLGSGITSIGLIGWWVS